MMGIFIILGCVLSCFCVGEATFAWDENLAEFAWNVKLNVCEPVPSGRVPWIIHVRNSEYGWNEHTHRAHIALAVNAYQGFDEEMKKMELQLELEITKALFRNESSKIHENDLALFIHALIATCKNPYDFYGTNLVADLLHRVEKTRGPVHPFLVLALCNAHAVTLQHLEKISFFAEHDHTTVDVDGRNAELKALTLKAYACAASRDLNLFKFQKEMTKAAECLTRRQNEMKDGTFGNVYTTSLAVQALTACRTLKNSIPDLERACNTWDESRAREFLLKESEINVNMIKAYYIEMALNSDNATFIKDLCPEQPRGPSGPPEVGKHYIHYSVKDGEYPEYYFTLGIQVEYNANFFDIMKKAADLSDRFGFNYTLNNEQLPMVHGVAGTPNDAEENMFWRFCRQKYVDYATRTSRTETWRGSPLQLIPEDGEHIALWYRSTNCPR